MVKEGVRGVSGEEACMSPVIWTLAEFFHESDGEGYVGSRYEFVFDGYFDVTGGDG